MKTIRKLSDRKLDAMQDRFRAKLGWCKVPAQRHLILKFQRKVFNERLRRLGL